MKLVSNVLSLGMFTASLVLFTILTLDIVNHLGQQSLFELLLWLVMGLIAFTFGKTILILNSQTIGGVQPPSLYYYHQCVRACASTCMCHANMFRVFHGCVPMWNHFMEPCFSAWQCVSATHQLARGSVVPRRTNRMFLADRGPQLFVLCSTNLEQVEPVEPDL